MARNLNVPFTNERPYYFISYNSEDETAVSKYVKSLTDKGLPIWYDRALEVGKIWQEQISVHMSECETVIMFLSKNIFEKETSYVHKEFEMATEYFSKRVIVVLLDKIDKKEVPPRFVMWWIDVNRLQCIEAFNCRNESECSDRILEALSFEKPAETLPAALSKKKGPVYEASYPASFLTKRNRLTHLRKLADIAEERVVCTSYTTLVLNEDGTAETTEITNDSYGIFDDGFSAAGKWKNIKHLTGELDFVAGLTHDGKVKLIQSKHLPAGSSTESWNNVKKIKSGLFALSGIKENGEACSAYLSDAKNYHGQDRAGKIKNADDVLFSYNRVIFRNKDGTMSATEFTGENIDDKTRWNEIRGWKNIRKLYSFGRGVIGIRDDGTLVASNVRENYKEYDYWQEIRNWKDVVELYQIENGAVALTEDGRVLTTEPRKESSESTKKILSELSQWDNLVKLYYSYAGGCPFIGLCSDGTVKVSSRIIPELTLLVEKDEILKWKDIAGIKVWYNRIIGIKRDGTLLCVGINDHGQGNVSEFKLFDDIESLAAKIENE